MSPSIYGKLDGVNSTGTFESEGPDWRRRKREDADHLEENPNDPIQYLPVEVVSHIFTLCLPDAPSDNISITRERYRHNIVPLQLGAVCWHWRRIAWSTPQLWNILWLSVTACNANTWCQLLPEWLARSGKLPLFVSMAVSGLLEEFSSAWDSTIRMVDTLRLYAKRWRVLKVHLPAFHLFLLSQSDYCALETLLVSPIAIFYKDPIRCVENGIECAKKSLRYVSITTGACWDISGLDWSNVIHLALDRFTRRQILKILGQAPNLEDLTLSYVKKDGLNPPPKIILNSLQKLRVYWSRLDTFNFSCPNLELLHCEYDESPVALADFITRWACPLTDLAINTCNGTLDGLFHLFDATPLLTRLSLQQSCMTNEFFERLHQSNTTTNSYLPHLRELHLRNTIGLNFKWSSVALLAPPMDHYPQNGVCRPLSKIHIKLQCLPDEEIFICEDDIIPILQMVERGIEHQ